MVGKIVDILSSWKNLINPNEEQIIKAKIRADICDTCPYKIELDSSILSFVPDKERLLRKFKCGKCGCPLGSKIFSNFKESCPDNKWTI